MSHALAQQVLTCMDLTSLNLQDTQRSISQLATAAHTEFGSPAALCVYPEWIVWSKLELQRLNLSAVKVATVTNFPHGDTDLQRAVAETQRAVSAGADEVDVVFPYRALMQGDTASGIALVQACRQVCGDGVRLKVIIESGVLAEPKLIQQASSLAIEAGADFIKTSTGKVPVNATLAAAEVMLEVIRASGGRVGFKAAGGVRTVAEAQAYLTLATRIMGAEWVTPAHFRFGASGLLQDVLAQLRGQAAATQQQGY